MEVHVFIELNMKFDKHFLQKQNKKKNKNKNKDKDRNKNKNKDKNKNYFIPIVNVANDSEYSIS